MNRQVVLWDLDGTLCDTRWRDDHARRKAWADFHAGIPKDQAFPHMLFLLRALVNNGAHILFLTARPELYRKQTESWIREVAQVFAFTLRMRKEGDFRSASIVKSELLDEHLERHPTDEILFALEDHAPVVVMWRSRGIPCFHVTDARE